MLQCWCSKVDRERGRGVCVISLLFCLQEFPGFFLDFLWKKVSACVTILSIHRTAFVHIHNSCIEISHYYLGHGL